MRGRNWILIGVGCFGVVCLVGVIALVVGGASVFQDVLEGPSGVNVEVTAPVSVALNQSFIIEVRVENIANEAQVLDSIDIADGYLEGVAIERVEPAITDSFHILGYQSYFFEREIPSRGVVIVNFFAVGVRLGDFQGDIDICINTGGSCLTRQLRTVVGS